mgnify:FL=1
MNTSMKKAISLVTCTALAAGCCTMAFAADGPVTKDENVFLFLNPDGSIQSQVVSDWLHSDSGLRGVTDRTSLTDITNLKSDAAYTLNGDALTWDTDDYDVYYQGSSTQTPPVTASIRYELNGQEMTAAEMLGKAGHVKITVKLTNHLKKTYQIGGAARSVYTPFATVVSMALGADDFTNVKAEHGTVQTDSQTQLVAFVTLPGMQETFKGLLTGDLSDLNDRLLDEVTLEADTDAFVMPTILLAASSSVEDLRDTVDDIPSLDETLNEVRDGMDELKDGSVDLDDGAHELDDGAHDLHDGAQELDDGASDLKDGAKDLDDGAKELNDKMGEFSAKYTEFDAGVSGAKSGMETLYAGLAKMKGQMDEKMLPGLARAAQLQADLEGQMGTIQGVLGGIPETSQLKAAQDTVTQAVTDAATNAANTAGQAVADAASDTAAQTSQAYAAAIGALLDNEELGFSDEQKAAVQAALSGVAEGLASEDNQEAVAATAQAAGEKTAAQVAAQGKVIQEALAPVAGLDTTAMKQQVGEVSTTANELMGLMNTLTTSLYNGENPLDDETIYGGTSQMAAGAQQLVGGAATLSGYSGQFKEAIGQFKGGTGELADGTGKLLDGTGELKDGTQELLDGTVDLVDGTGKLVDGTQELLDGVDEFRDKIEEKAGDVDTKQIDDALDTLDALQTEAESYTTYTGTPDGVEASIKFVMKVEEPEAPAAETETEPTAQQTEKPSFWQRLKQLFGLG